MALINNYRWKTAYGLHQVTSSSGGLNYNGVGPLHVLGFSISLFNSYLHRIIIRPLNFNSQLQNINIFA